MKKYTWEEEATGGVKRAEVEVVVVVVVEIVDVVVSTVGIRTGAEES